MAASADPSSVGLPASMTMASTWNTVWDLDATVLPSDTVTNTGEAAVRVRSGVRVLLNEAEKICAAPTRAAAGGNMKKCLIQGLMAAALLAAPRSL